MIAIEHVAEFSQVKSSELRLPSQQHLNSWNFRVMRRSHWEGACNVMRQQLWSYENLGDKQSQYTGNHLCMEPQNPGTSWESVKMGASVLNIHLIFFSLGMLTWAFASLLRNHHDSLQPMTPEELFACKRFNQISYLQIVLAIGWAAISYLIPRLD